MHHVAFLTVVDERLHWAVRATAETLPTARAEVLEALRGAQARVSGSPLLRAALGLEEGAGAQDALEAMVDAYLVEARADYLVTGLTAPQRAAVEAFLSKKPSAETTVPPQGARPSAAMVAGDPVPLRLSEAAFRAHLACHRRYERRVCALQNRLLAALLTGGPFRAAAKGLEAMAEAWEANLSRPGPSGSFWPTELEARLHGAALSAALQGCQEELRARLRSTDASEDAASGRLLALLKRLINPSVRVTTAKSWPQDWAALDLDDPASRVCAALLYEQDRDLKADGFDLIEPLVAARDHCYHGLGLDPMEGKGERDA